jgi:hypothetical protein
MLNNSKIGEKAVFDLFFGLFFRLKQKKMGIYLQICKIIH